MNTKRVWTNLSNMLLEGLVKQMKLNALAYDAAILLSKVKGWLEITSQYTGLCRVIHFGIIMERGWMKSNQTRTQGEDKRDNEDDSCLENEIESDDELLELLTDCFPSTIQGDETDVNFFEHCEEPNDNANKFYTLLRDLEQPLYEGSKCSKLSAVMKLLHIKTLGGWSNKSFTMLLEFLKNELLPSCSLLPDSYYEAKKK